MTRPTKQQLKHWLSMPGSVEDLAEVIRQSPTTPSLVAAIRRVVPDLDVIQPLTYTLYREFEHTGSRPGYQEPYFRRRAQLTRAVLEVLLGDDTALDRVHDLAWAICEETSWVLPAHEEQGPAYWEIDPPYERTEPFGAHTALTRPPDAIDLFAAETGAALAETVYLVGMRLAPEVRQRIRQEVQRHIFGPYLACARDHWWFQGPLNWNGVCNGAIGLAFLRLEQDVNTLVDALALVLEGLEAYIATGFEADGGSIEGVGYWNYGLMYTITVAELLRQITSGELDLLAQPRLRDIACYPVGMALVAPNRFINFGDAKERQSLAVGVVSRLAKRTGVDSLQALFTPLEDDDVLTQPPLAKLPIVLRHAAWWDQTQPLPELVQQDFYLPDSGVIKLVGEMPGGETVLLAAKAGHNDGHHSHTDIGTFILNVNGDSLIPDSGRGLYSKEYFRRGRYQNVFNNSYTHNVPRIDGHLQAPGPEFGGGQQFHGRIVEHGRQGSVKFVVIDFHAAYDLPALTQARRTLRFDTASGEVTLEDVFAFAGSALPIEEAFVTWFAADVDGHVAHILGQRATLTLTIDEPGGAVFTVESLEDACRANQRGGILNRLAVVLPNGATRFRLRLTPFITG